MLQNTVAGSGGDGGKTFGSWWKCPTTGIPTTGSAMRDLEGLALPKVLQMLPQVLQMLPQILLKKRYMQMLLTMYHAVWPIFKDKLLNMLVALKIRAPISYRSS